MYYKKRIFNFRNLATVLLIFAVLLLTYLFLFIIPVITQDSTAPDYSIDIIYSNIAQVLNWRAVKFGGQVVYQLYPVFAFLPLLNFREDWLTYFSFGRHRFKSFNKEVVKTILFYGALLSAIMFLGHALYYTFMIPFILDPTWGFGEFLTEHFIPAGTFDQCGYLYLIVEAFFVSIIGGFTFSTMTIAVLVWTTNRYWMFFVPLTYYYGSINLYKLLATPEKPYEFLSIYHFLSGELPLHVGLWHALIPISISMILIVLALRKEKRGGVIAY